MPVLVERPREMVPVSIAWLSESQMYGTLRVLANRWTAMRKKTENARSDLSEILFDVWISRCGLDPAPDIAVALDDRGNPVGVLSGFDCPSQRYFQIAHLAVHPRCPAASRQVVLEKLVEAAIDKSISLGYHGWVAVCPERGTENAWNALGFFRHDVFTFRRMGYFQGRR
ncbi:hypothetical protein GCM10025857_39080 [Alicyclobacillus contaminans]|uniref:hypothetical protein n=1 Tax=Alicyclobacillus contaminans TaxID=392016 RepID=UPI0003FC93AE|nr:hypothetical protein [Alicyclobacillus contaminans]GMA52551.1 hypothetical protein GCM10025857_39080 [Alicyclobacillus contaminans]